MDGARRRTNKQLKSLEDEIRRVFKEAEKDISEKWDAYMEKSQKKLEALHDAYINASDGKKREAKEKYKKAVEEQTLKDKQFKAMRNSMVNRITNANDTAAKYTNGKLPGIYSTNYNFLEPDLYKAGIRFDLVDEATIRRLIEDGDIQLPFKNLNKKKDKAWNTKKINNAILQGILQGESIPQIAERLMKIIGNNEAAAIRNARTLVTGAENRGRLDRYKSLEDDGVILNKVWLATGDGRTRDWHADMDGQEVGTDESFVDGLGNELEYPGDPSGPPETVYNCRCTMHSRIIGFKGKDGKIHYV